MNTLPITIDRCELSRVGLTMAEGLDVHEWGAIGRSLCAVNESALWWIGDWINYGQAAYGEKYAEALKVFGSEVLGELGYEEQTLRLAASVSRRVALLNRINNLSWTHHLIISPLPEKEQRKWLKKASDEKWSVKDLKSALKANDANPLAGVTHDVKPDINVKLLAVTSWFNRLELAKIETPRLEALQVDIETKLIPIKTAIEEELKRRAA